MFYNQEQNNEYYVVNPAGLTMISLEEEDQVEISAIFMEGNLASLLSIILKEN